MSQVPSDHGNPWSPDRKAGERARETDVVFRGGGHIAYCRPVSASCPVEDRAARSLMFWTSARAGASRCSSGMPPLRRRTRAAIWVSTPVRCVSCWAVRHSGAVGPRDGFEEALQAQFAVAGLAAVVHEDAEPVDDVVRGRVDLRVGGGLFRQARDTACNPGPSEHQKVHPPGRLHRRLQSAGPIRSCGSVSTSADNNQPVTSAIKTEKAQSKLQPVAPPRIWPDSPERAVTQNVILNSPGHSVF